MTDEPNVLSPALVPRWVGGPTPGAYAQTPIGDPDDDDWGDDDEDDDDEDDDEDDEEPMQV
ncbi:MAG TPA: hypothetical protein VFO33_10250 [Casimicrobiaceae bacterium]|nr:hypothetical protein [Casimicrobiaceae bacterium]